jgi:hypothetical protein
MRPRSSRSRFGALPQALDRGHHIGLLRGDRSAELLRPVELSAPAQPDVIYVPYYNPALVYGAWPYAAYPPYYFAAPVGYVAGPGLWFGAGVALGFAWDRWGNVGRFNWHDGNIYVHGNVNAPLDGRRQPCERQCPRQ